MNIQHIYIYQVWAEIRSFPSHPTPLPPMIAKYFQNTNFIRLVTFHNSQNHANKRNCALGQTLGERYNVNRPAAHWVYTSPDIFTRTAFTLQIHLNRHANARGYFGVYKCDVSDQTGANISATSIITYIEIRCIFTKLNPYVA